MADRAYITPKVLKWARETARMSADVAASKVNVTAEKLQEWEDGISLPTINQAENLAKAYRRPFAMFFLPDIPNDFLPLQDFRKKDSRPLGTASVFIIREMQQKQEWISDMLQENFGEPLPFVGSFSINSDPKAVANDIIKVLKINHSYYTNNVIKDWIEKAEANGIFVSRTSFVHSRLKLDSEEIQGFAIADVYAPFIFINSDDWNAPQLFTLVHELAHIWIAESGISNETEIGTGHKEKFHPVELFCNDVAANALMPSELMNKVDRKFFANSRNIFSMAKKLGVSSISLAVRALNLQLISPIHYQKLKHEIELDFIEFKKREEEKMEKQKKSDNGPSYYVLNLQKNGKLFTQTVLDAFRGGLIEPTLASMLLNVKSNKFSSLESLMNP